MKVGSASEKEEKENGTKETEFACAGVEVGRRCGEQCGNPCGYRRNSSCPCVAVESGDRGGDSACQPVLVERIKGRVADQMVDVPVPLVMEEMMAVVRRGGEVGPTGTSTTADRRANCGWA